MELVDPPGFLRLLFGSSKRRSISLTLHFGSLHPHLKVYSIHTRELEPGENNLKLTCSDDQSGHSVDHIEGFELVESKGLEVGISGAGIQG